MMRRKKPENSHPVSNELKQSVRRVVKTPDGKALLDFLRQQARLDIPTYGAGKSHEEMIHHGARKALVQELLDLMEA